MTYRTAVLAFGALFTVVAFICLMVAVCTNEWLVIQIDQSSLTGTPVSLAFQTRRRGLFKECYEDLAATKTFVRANAFADEFKECIKNDFMIPRRTGISYSNDYKLRADLMMCMVVFFCFALVLCVVGFGVFCYSCSLLNVMDQANKSWKLSTKWAGILIFLAAFFNAGGMAFYHGAEYVETQLINSNSAEVPYEFFFRLSQPTVLQEATSRVYSWSYALGWLAVFFEVLAAILLFVCGACCGPERRREKDQFLDFNTLNSSRSWMTPIPIGYGQRNLAYEYMEGGKAPVIYEAQPPRQAVTDAAYHQHFGGRHFDPYSRQQPVQQQQQMEPQPQYNYDDGGWRWQ